MLIDFPCVPLSVDALFGDSQYKELSNWIRSHRPVGSATECDGLEDLPFARMIGNAIRLALELPGRVGDTLPDQASGGVAWRGSTARRLEHSDALTRSK